MKATRVLRRGRRAASARLVVLTGLSGSGKSQAIRALEDLGYFCVDNLPTVLMPMLAELTLRVGSEIEKAAIVVDVRERTLLAGFPKVFARLQRMRGLNPSLIFLEASDDILVRRFSETRRPHPLRPGGSLAEGIKQERRLLAPIKRLADVVLDTSDMTVHELRQAFMAIARGSTGARGPVVTFLSFGFKHGLPLDADLVFDVRFLPNPHFVPRLRPKTGRDRDVAKFVGQFAETGEFIERTSALLRFLLPQYANEGKSYVTIAIGCTGGRHRSVALAEALRRDLAGLEGFRLRVHHRDIASE